MNTSTGIGLMLLFSAVAAYAHWGKTRWLNGLCFTFSVFVFGTAAMTFPSLFTSWGGFELKKVIVPLVQLILFGMGMTLTVEDFTRVLKMPKAIVVGTVLQYTIMPTIGFACTYVFGLKGEVAAGLILIGSCPGGVSSNVISYLARANVPLSVTLTAVSTLVSPIMTPLAMKVLAGTYIPIAFLPMMESIMTMIILPLVAGILIYRYLPRLAARMVHVLPFMAMSSICIIIAITVAMSRDDLLKVGLALLAASAVHNAVGYLLGYQGARLAGLDARDCRTVALEVGLQNCGMATGLAFNVLKSAQAAMASATFGPWSMISSSILASWWRRQSEKEDALEKK